MERFSIRILYRDRNDPWKFVGVVERDGEAAKRGFVSMEGLWRIISSPDNMPGGRKAVSSGTGERRARAELIDMFRRLREE